MSEGWIIDVAEQDFEQAVMARSQELPVLLDLWAPWCEPCKQLTPILEQVVEEFGGRVLLAKVDIDQNQNLAAALRVQSIPMVMLFVGGRPVDGFMGAQRAEAVREMLRRHVPTTVDDVLQEVRGLLAAGEIEAGIQRVEGVLAEEADNHEARLLRARLALAAGDEAGVREHVAKLPEGSAEARQAKHLADVFAFQQACGDAGEAARAAEASPEDDAATYRMGCCHAAAGRYEEALAAWLEIVKRNRGWNEDAARKAMLVVFGVLGPGDDLARAYRRELAIYL